MNIYKTQRVEYWLSLEIQENVAFKDLLKLYKQASVYYMRPVLVLMKIKNLTKLNILG